MRQMELFENVETVEACTRVDGCLHFDGSCWPNPGPNSKCGIIVRAGMKMVEKTIHLGDGTNNTAEYYGLIHGLQAAIDLGVTHLEVYGDSQLVINGVKRGPRPNGKPHLEKLKREAIDLIRRFKDVDLNWVPREQNTEADELSTR